MREGALAETVPIATLRLSEKPRRRIAARRMPQTETEPQPDATISILPSDFSAKETCGLRFDSALAQNDVPRMESTLNELQESLQKVGQAVYGGGQQQPPGSGPGGAGGQQSPPPGGPGPDDDNTVEGNFREV